MPCNKVIAHLPTINYQNLPEQPTFQKVNRFYSLLGFNPNINSLRNEIVAGLTTFLVMVYILALAPNILHGVVNDITAQQMFTVTALACAMGSLLMAFIARVPIGVGPAVGGLFLAANSVTNLMGYSFSFVLTAVFIEGLLFLIMSLTGLRQAIVESLPDNLKRAIALGIGLFIASLGFKNCGIFENDGLFGLLDNLTMPTHQLFCIGLILTGIMIMRKVPGAMLFGIIITTLIGIPMGVTKIDGIMSIPASPMPVVLHFAPDQILTADMFVVVTSLLVLDIFDTVGSAIGVMSIAGHINKRGRVPRMSQIFIADSLSTIVGSCMGLTTCTSYVESASGAAEGGKTGMTALVVSLCFFVSLFFSPLFLAIPPAATGPVLVLVGVILFGARQVDTHDPVELIPCFLTIIVMPVSGSIFDGVVLGIVVYGFLSSFRSILFEGIFRKNNS